MALLQVTKTQNTSPQHSNWQANLGSPPSRNPVLNPTSSDYLIAGNANPRLDEYMKHTQARMQTESYDKIEENAQNMLGPEMKI